MSECKVIRSWRVQPGRPYGVHIWYDPAVERVHLLEGPEVGFPVGVSETTEEVDSDPDQLALWDSASVSGGGKREACVEENEPDLVGQVPDLTDIPF